MGKELTMHNGDVGDDAHVCHQCQRPGADVRAADGEWYHHDCIPEELL